MLHSTPSNLQCWRGEAGGLNPGQAPHGPVYQGELNDEGGPKHKPPGVVLGGGGVWEDPPDRAENSPGTHC